MKLSATPSKSDGSLGTPSKRTSAFAGFLLNQRTPKSARSTPASPESTDKLSLRESRARIKSPLFQARSSLRHSVPSEDLLALRRLSSQAARQHACEMAGMKLEATAREERLSRLEDRFVARHRRSQARPSASTARLLTRMARSAAIVAGCSVMDGDPSHMHTAQERLDECLEALLRDRSLSLPLVRNLRSLCWHSAQNAARKRLLTQQHKRPPGAWKQEEIKRRLDDVRAEIATDRGREAFFCPPKQAGWRGVNVGGWLLWETGPANNQPMLKALGHAPLDEWTLSKELRERFGDAAATRLVSEHRASHVTKQDFSEIAALGLNSVRVPFGYWIVTGPRPGEPFIGPDLGCLDNCFAWAEETGLKLILSFHGHPGFQSDHQASGRSSDDWDPEQWRPDEAVHVLEQVCLRYGQRACLGGIGVVNEPSCLLPLDKLQSFYKDAYRIIRQSKVPENVQVILPVYQRSFDDFRGIFTEQHGYRNVVFDVHCYHLFSENWYRMSLGHHLRWAAGTCTTHDVRDIAKHGERVIVTEWCLALPTWDFRMLSAWEWSELTRSEKHNVLRSFAARQLRSFATHSDGWFFWSWKDEENSQWNFKEALAKEFLPAGLCPAAVKGMPIKKTNALQASNGTSCMWRHLKGKMEALEDL